MPTVLLALLVWCVLYSISVCALLALSHYKNTQSVSIFETPSLRLGLLGICTLLCCSAWRFWYVAAGQHETTWVVGLGTFVLVLAPIAWVYYKRKQNEEHGTWLITKQR